MAFAIAKYWSVVQKTLEEVQESYKKQANKKRSKPKEFKVGDTVYLSKYLQSRQSSKKLDPKYIGPFPISKIINPVTVQLELPKMLRCIHPVFQCRLLKQSTTSPLCPVMKPLPDPTLIEGEQHFEVKHILDSCTHRGKIQYLVAWKDFPLWRRSDRHSADKHLKTSSKVP